VQVPMGCARRDRSSKRRQPVTRSAIDGSGKYLTRFQQWNYAGSLDLTTQAHHIGGVAMSSKVAGCSRVSSAVLAIVYLFAACAFSGPVLADSASRVPDSGNSVASEKGKSSKSGLIRAPVEKWRLVESQSGPVNYYSLLRDADRPFIRGSYQPPNKKAVFGFEVPEAGRSRVQRLDWNWRAIKLPLMADECSAKKGDSPAVLYVTWRRMLRWYSLKYVWSATRPVGTVCDRRRNAFVAQDTVVLESGGPLGVWKHEALDLAREFRTHFEDGDPNADVPPLIGLGVMTDGDQTKTESTGDYADFVFSL
jgi:hypothetical protein